MPCVAILHQHAAVAMLDPRLIKGCVVWLTPRSVLCSHGQHLHEVLPVESGRRLVLIMWCRSSKFREQTCPCWYVLMPTRVDIRGAGVGLKSCHDWAFTYILTQMGICCLFHSLLHRRTGCICGSEWN